MKLHVNCIKFETKSIHKLENICNHFFRFFMNIYIKLIVNIIKIISCQGIPQGPHLFDSLLLFYNEESTNVTCL
jgi:hypothetical protein